MKKRKVELFFGVSIFQSGIPLIDSIALQMRKSTQLFLKHRSL